MERSGDTTVVTPPIDAAGRTYDIGYTVTDAAGEQRIGQGHRDRHRTERARPHRRRRPGPDHPGRRRLDPACSATTSIRSARGLTIVGANVSDGSGTATVSGDQIVYTPDAGYFGAATFTYTVEDARHTAAGQGVGTVGVTVIGRPGTPSTPQATADNATATVTWELPPANGAPLTGGRVAARGSAHRSRSASRAATP